MMNKSIPPSLAPYQKRGEQLLHQGAIGEVEFSRETYQIEVQENGESWWVFLQVDDRGTLKDGFCSCTDGHDATACPHLTASFLWIVRGGEPLHRRFYQSLWHEICRLYAERARGEQQEVEVVAGSKGRYTLTMHSSKSVAVFVGRNEQGKSKLRQLLVDHEAVDEYNSIKFSNRTEEELNSWRIGEPSDELAYELSFWSDLAKWLFLLQEKEQESSVVFSAGQEQLPNQLQMVSEELEIKFFLSKATLAAIIPYLNTVHSDLKFYPAAASRLKKVAYEPAEACFYLTAQGNQRTEFSEDSQSIAIDRWVYVPADGFYERFSEDFFGKRVVYEEGVDGFLTDHLSTIRQADLNVQLHLQTVPVSYSLFFDREWNLHIEALLFVRGDLSKGFSRLYQNWAYIDEDGFYRIAGNLFKGVATTIPAEKISDFIRDRRIWLNQQVGFGTHMSGVEAEVHYAVRDDNTLFFYRSIRTQGDVDAVRQCDFGAWVYIEGKGFFPKVTSSLTIALHQDLELSQQQIPIFIRVNRDELQLVPGFFAARCPVIRSGLNITLSEEGVVTVSPAYEYIAGIDGASVKVFEDFVYLPGEGFSEMPAAVRLPERFRHVLQFDQESLPFFFSYELESIRDHVFSIDPRLEPARKLQLTVKQISREDRHGKRWYTLNLSYSSEQGSVSLTSLWGAMRRNRRFLFSEAGLIDLEERRYNWVRMLGKERIDNKTNHIALSTLELVRLDALEGLVLEGVLLEEDEEGSTGIEGILAPLSHSVEIAAPNIQGLNSPLRPYQKLGLEWLWFLYNQELSGLLCDDMGLGKTHQAMALMVAIVNHSRQEQLTTKAARPRFLIICPTSVLFHWEEKLKNYLPDLRFWMFYGLDRSTRVPENWDVLITSYGVWRLEAERFKEEQFAVAIFDEMQIAKNYATRTHASLHLVNAKMRLGLTGTPIENHLRELKALFDIALPSYMPPEEEYREYFVKPIERTGDEERKQLLRRLIKPFVLRRKKEDVLPDLPVKSEEISYCALSQDQERLYNEALMRSREHLLHELEDTQRPIPYLHIFALLTSLKQICDHPAVYLKEPKNYKAYSSGKWELFTELLHEAQESEQKVVVFSQYLGMLDIISFYLEENGIEYASIRGATKKRTEEIQRFKKDPRCRVFVASLQAAGLGIDLTAASVVIHYDRLWTAAREQQATDRVHRIGQQRGVQVFKLICKRTFEEQIDRLIAKKGALFEEIIGKDESTLLKKLSRDEWMELLSLTQNLPEQ